MMPLILCRNYKRIQREQLKAERDEKIRSMWMACCTLEEIGEEVNQTPKAVANDVESFVILESLPKLQKNLAQFNDSEFQVPLYSQWNFGKLTNGTSHFGNSEQRILENLLYLYTEPFDIVLDLTSLNNPEVLPERNRDSKDPESFDFKPVEYCFIRHSFRNQTRQRKPIPEYKSFRDLEK